MNQFHSSVKNATIKGTSFLSSGLKYRWHSVKASGFVYDEGTKSAKIQMVDKRKMFLNSFDGTITFIDGTKQIWVKGTKISEEKHSSKEDKTLIKKHFQCTDKELNSLDNKTIKSLVESIKKETKIVIQPVYAPMNLNSTDWEELALLNSDLESSDFQSRVIPDNDLKVNTNTLFNDWTKELVSNALKDAKAN